MAAVVPILPTNRHLGDACTQDAPITTRDDHPAAPFNPRRGVPLFGSTLPKLPHRADIPGNCLRCSFGAPLPIIRPIEPRIELSERVTTIAVISTTTRPD